MWPRGIDMKWTNILNNIASSEKVLVVYQKNFLARKIRQSFFFIRSAYCKILLNRQYMLFEI